MTQNEEQELLTLTRDNNKMLRDIWSILQDPNEDIKNFVMDVVANLTANKIENGKSNNRQSYSE